MLVHQLICQGDRNSVAFHGPQDITYGQLQAEVARYRAYLRHAGVRAGENVGLLTRNSPAFVYAYMAIVSLGAVVVPINYQLTAAEIAYIVTDARMKNLVTAARLDLAAPHKTCACPAEPVQHLLADIGAFSPLPGDEAGDGEQLDENRPCTIIYTSGTTGNPKGAVLTHKSLVSDAVCYSRAMPVHQTDNILCILPLYHCLAWTCIILCGFLHKASVTIVDSLVPKEVIDAVKRYGVTVIYGVPSVYMLLLRTA